MAVAVLVFLAGPLKGTTRALEEGDLSIGRDESVTLAISDPALSRQHCVVRRTADVITVTDLESLNGTFVNGVPIAERTLQDGDHLRIGDTLCLVVRTANEAPFTAIAGGTAVVLPEHSTVWIRREDSRYLQPPTYDTESRAARDLSVLLEVSTAIHTERRRDTLYDRLLELTMTAIPADTVALMLGDADTELAPVARRDASVPLAISQTVVDQVFRTGAAVLSNDVDIDESFGHAPSLVGSDTRSLVCAPVTRFERPLGVVYLASRDPRRFDADDLQLLMGIAGISATAFDRVDDVERLERETERLRDDLALSHDMVGESVAMRDMYQAIARVAGTLSTVLIRGESGTGKELAARAIHGNSARADRPFVAVNCAALTDSLLESELFGHEKGAFTGAVAQKRGKLELADGGTFFLDEIGELAPPIQVKLLRVLQERQFERVGGTRPIKVDIRLIAATNRDLKNAIATGAFRSDLYYRLNVVSLTMPPLRDRREDVPLLANYFIAKYSARCNRRVRGIGVEARESLMRYDWPGNVRELENAIERAVVMGSTDRILREDLPETIVEGDPPDEIADQYYRAVNETKRRVIINAVERAHGSYTEAARLLGVHPNYLHRLVKNLQLKNRLTSGRAHES